MLSHIMTQNNENTDESNCEHFQEISNFYTRNTSQMQ
jgi:hypothetical protein